MDRSFILRGRDATFLVTLVSLWVFGTPSFAQVDQREFIEISVESAINDAVSKDKADVEAEHQKGRTNVAPMDDSKTWMSMSPLQRHYYLRGLGNLNSFLVDVSSVARTMLDSQVKSKGLKHSGGLAPSYLTGMRAADVLNTRLSEVLAGRSYGDLSDAVTKFYENNPLLRDRPVLWVLSVSLYKELKASRPKPEKGSVEALLADINESVTVAVTKERPVRKGK